MLKRILSIVILSLTLLAQLPSNAFAVTTPSFPSCINPQGALKVSHSSGTHGIVGSTETYTGSDSVYTLSSDTLVQCFCPANGSGIQTNWWKISNLTDSEIKVLESQGWIFVPNGALWGLQEGPYLAQNMNFSCNGGVGGASFQAGTGGGSVSGVGSQTELSGVGGGSVMGFASNVLGLASTGNITLIYSLIILGVLAITLGAALRKKTTN